MHHSFNLASPAVFAFNVRHGSSSSAPIVDGRAGGRGGQSPVRASPSLSFQPLKIHFRMSAPPTTWKKVHMEEGGMFHVRMIALVCLYRSMVGGGEGVHTYYRAWVVGHRIHAFQLSACDLAPVP